MKEIADKGRQDTLRLCELNIFSIHGLGEQSAVDARETAKAIKDKIVGELK